ncbi:Inner membrane protein yccS [Pragia fontium]|uniref:YccS/YhfK family putative transporter n=1 Tax=Pragia fontium TaxID=82985 RepID=UPI000DF8B00C|nr:YccS/YhfK family putative transporter [Pragia fontium]SUB81110.1 Inner membrane protein yccS [Pragia fontium]
MWRRVIYHPEINYALRQTLVLCLPIALFWLLNDLRTGFLLSLVPACCNIGGLDTPHKRFFKRLAIGGALFVLSSLLLQQFLIWSIPLGVCMLILALLFGVTAEISPLHGRLMPAALVAGIFTLSMVDVLPIWYAPMLFMIGTIWYGLFTYVWFRLWQEQPMRESLSLLYRQLADYFEEKYSLLTQHTDPETALPPLLQRQQQAMDSISLVYQQIYMITDLKHPRHQRLMRAFQVALDLQEHITVSLHQPDEVQKLVEQSHAEAVIRHNAKIISHRLRILADDILYHRRPSAFNMDHELSALEKIANQHPDNPVGAFCYYHFSRIAYLLSSQLPLYNRSLMPAQNRLPFWRALKNYCSIKSIALRNAARLGLTLAAGTAIGSVLSLPKPYWILLTIMLVSQNGYNATRIRIQHRALGTMFGIIVGAVILHLHYPQNYMLLLMLFLTLVSYLIVRKNYGIAVIGFTITAVYTLQIIANSGMEFLLPRLIDTVIGCVLVFASTIWLWPQWQSGLLRKNAHDALETYQQHLRQMFSMTDNAPELSYTRMKVNQAHNTLFTTLNQAMQEPGFNSRYLTDMRLWITHSQFLVEHLNGMTVIARDQYVLIPELSKTYLNTCEIMIQSCQQRLEYDGPSSDTSMLQIVEPNSELPETTMERHLERVLAHLKSMHTISSLAWQQRPHHGIWLKRRLRDKS